MTGTKLLGRGHTILTSRVLMCYYTRSRDVRGGLTLNSVTQIHSSVTLLTSRGALVGSRASTPLTFLLLHTFREAWPTCRVHSTRHVGQETDCEQTAAGGCNSNSGESWDNTCSKSQQGVVMDWWWCLSCCRTWVMEEITGIPHAGTGQIQYLYLESKRVATGSLPSRICLLV